MTDSTKAAHEGLDSFAMFRSTAAHPASLPLGLADVHAAIDRAIEAVNKAWHEPMQHAIHRNHQ